MTHETERDLSIAGMYIHSRQHDVSSPAQRTLSPRAADPAEFIIFYTQFLVFDTQFLVVV